MDRGRAEPGLFVAIVVMVLVEYIEDDLVGERLIFAAEFSFSEDCSRDMSGKSVREDR